MVGWAEAPVQETDCVGAWESSSSDRYGVFYMIIQLKYHASAADSQDRIKVMPTLCQGGFRGELRGTMPTPQQNVRNDPHSKGEILYCMAEGPVRPSSPQFPHDCSDSQMSVSWVGTAISKELGA